MYNTYKSKNVVEPKIIPEVVVQSDPDTNSFTDIEYSGFDLNGNRYILKAGQAEFKTQTPAIINMKNVIATFFFKDDTFLTVISNEGLYNNRTLDMDFYGNVKSTYLTHSLFSDRLNYSNSNGKLIATGNVKGESVDKGEFFADNLEYDLTNKTLDFSMFEQNDQVNVKLKK